MQQQLQRGRIALPLAASVVAAAAFVLCTCVCLLPAATQAQQTSLVLVPGSCDCTNDADCGCENNAECVDRANNTHTCMCRQGFESRRCETAYDPCDGTPCGTGNCTYSSTVLRDTADFECSCTKEFVGDTCDVPCPANCTSCIELNDKGICTQCDSGFAIDNTNNECVTECPFGTENQDGFCNDINICLNITCANGGTCDRNAASDATACICPTGYDQPRCLTGQACNGVDCGNGECYIDDGVAKCDCDAGFEGTNCTINIDDCDPDPCNGETCIDGINNYTCSCPSHLGGPNCEVQINCAAGACEPNGVCKSIATGFECECDPGWEGDSCTDDIDECAPDVFPCLNNGVCTTPTINSFHCECPTGFTGDRCEESPCIPSPCTNNGTCSVDDITGNFLCNCTGTGFAGSICQYVDKCVEDPTLCGENVCESTGSSYVCVCPDGSKQKNCPPPTTTPPTTTTTSTTSAASTNAPAKDKSLLTPPVQYGLMGAAALLAVVFTIGLGCYCRNNRPTKAARRKTRPPSMMRSFSNPAFNPDIDSEDYLTMPGADGSTSDGYMGLDAFQNTSPTKRPSVPRTAWQKKSTHLDGIQEEGSYDDLGSDEEEKLEGYLEVGTADASASKGASTGATTAAAATTTPAGGKVATAAGGKKAAAPNAAKGGKKPGKKPSGKKPKQQQKPAMKQQQQQQQHDSYMDLEDDQGQQSYMDVATAGTRPVAKPTTYSSVGAQPPQDNYLDVDNDQQPQDSYMSVQQQQQQQQDNYLDVDNDQQPQDSYMSVQQQQQQQQDNYLDVDNDQQQQDNYLDVDNDQQPQDSYMSVQQQQQQQQQDNYLNVDNDQQPQDDYFQVDKSTGRYMSVDRSQQQQQQQDSYLNVTRNDAANEGYMGFDEGDDDSSSDEEDFSIIPKQQQQQQQQQQEGADGSYMHVSSPQQEGGNDSYFDVEGAAKNPSYLHVAGNKS